MERTRPAVLTVVPALFLLIVIVSSQEQEGRRAKFGSRVQQARSLCSDFTDCKFGFKFEEKHSDRSRNIVFVPPKTEPPASDVQNANTRVVNKPVRGRFIQQNQSVRGTAREENNFLDNGRNKQNIDPRRRQKNNGRNISVTKSNTIPKPSNVNLKVQQSDFINRNQASSPPTKVVHFTNNGREKVTDNRFFIPEDTHKEGSDTAFQVSIEIGGTPIFIPNFELSSPEEAHTVLELLEKEAKAEAKLKSQQRTFSLDNSKGTNPPRANLNPINSRRRIPQIVTTPPQTVTPPSNTPQSSFSTTLRSFRNLDRGLIKTGTNQFDVPRGTNRHAPEDPTNLSLNKDNTQKPRLAPRRNRISAPRFRPRQRSKSNSQQSRRRQPSTTKPLEGQFAEISTVNSFQNFQPPGTILTTRRPRIKSSTRQFQSSPQRTTTTQKKTTVTISTTRTDTPSTTVRTTISRQSGECPGTLEICVDACIPLEDIYAYSACVVECGERC